MSDLDVAEGTSSDLQDLIDCLHRGDRQHRSDARRGVRPLGVNEPEALAAFDQADTI
jgi:hypothetical protein